MGSGARSLGGFWCLGGVLEALGGSLNRCLEALGRIREATWGEMSSKIEEKTIDNYDRHLVSIVHGFLIIV